MAKEVGVHHSTVQDVIGGKRNPSEIRHLEPKPEDTRPSIACWTPAEVDPADREPMTLVRVGDHPGGCEILTLQAVGNRPWWWTGAGG